MKSSHKLGLAVALALGLAACGKEEPKTAPKTAAPAEPAGTVGRDDQQGPAIASYVAKELKAKKVAIVDDKTAYGEGIANEVEKTLKGAKVNVVGRERTTDKETDFKAILTKIKAKNPDVVFHGSMDATGGPRVKQDRATGIEAVHTFGDGACTDDIGTLADAA